MRPGRFIRPSVILLATLLAVGGALAQEHAFVPVGDWSYTYIERLQRRGLLLELNPTALPYTRGDVAAALGTIKKRRLSRAERGWVELLRSEFRRSRRNGRGTKAGTKVDIGLRSINGERLDVLRPEATSDPTLPLGGLNLYPNAGLHGYLQHGRAIAHAGARFDIYYRDDAEGLDAANRLITRNDESYIGYDGRFASVYLGRIGRHWAPPSSAALMLSDNAVSMDQIAFRFGGDRLSWQGFLGELDSATPDGRFTGTAGADSVGGSIRRYLAIHRVDWRPSKRLGFSVMEATLYSGPNAGPSVKYLNPLLIHFFSLDGRPKNEENNGLIAGLLWAHYQRWTLSGQLTIDDLDILAETGERISAALNGTLIYSGLPFADLGASATLVTARAYNTHQPEGRYIYLNRGLATNFSDFVHVSAFSPIYLDHAVEGVTVTPKLDLLLQGERDIRQPYPVENIETILTGTTERVIRPALEIRLQPERTWWIRIDLGPSFTSNSNHRDGVIATRWTALAEFGARVRLDRRVNLSL